MFVLLWSSGYIGALYGLPYAEPFTLLAFRYFLVTLILCIAALVSRPEWPIRAIDWLHASVVGVLIHVGCLGGVFVALNTGVKAGTVALIVSSQPLLTATIAGLFLREVVTARQWFGLVLGFSGVLLIVWHSLGLGTGDGTGVALAVLALISITAGSLYQRRFCASMSLLSGNAIQFFAAALVSVLLAFTLESGAVVWSGALVFALFWLVLVLSIGATSLLYVLLRSGKAVGVASLFFLVPPITALLAFIFFGQQMPTIALVGMALTVVGVALARQSAQRA